MCLVKYRNDDTQKGPLLRSAHKPNGHKLERPQTKTTTDRNGHKLKIPQWRFMAYTYNMRWDYPYFYSETTVNVP